MPGAWPVRMIRLGAVVATLGVVLSAFVFPTGSVLGVIVAGLFLGGGFGLSWAFMSQRVLTSLPDEERAIGAAAMTTVRLTGSAVGRKAMDANGKAVPAAPITITFEFVNRDGAVVTTQDVAIPALAEGAKHEISVAAQGQGIVAWRYKQK